MLNFGRVDTEILELRDIDTLPKNNRHHPLRIDGWNNEMSCLVAKGLFSGANLLLVSGRCFFLHLEIKHEYTEHDGGWNMYFLWWWCRISILKNYGWKDICLSTWYCWWTKKHAALFWRSIYTYTYIYTHITSLLYLFLNKLIVQISYIYIDVFTVAFNRLFTASLNFFRVQNRKTISSPTAFNTCQTDPNGACLSNPPVQELSHLWK